MLHNDWRTALAAVEELTKGDTERMYNALAGEIAAMESRGERVPAALRSHLNALEADIMEERYDNLPI